ncbi:MAG: helix-turn-helix domain-containing protein [Clostridia bacterium]|nr:helix-turn-helix domain-containing protein [Clostridia bacterium]
MNCKEIFQDSLQELLVVHNLTIKDLSTAASVCLSPLYRYINGESAPSLSNAIKIADYFGCSLDYLFGLDDTYTKDTYRIASTPNKRFREFLKAQGCSRYKIHKATGLEEKLLFDWFHGVRAPSLANLYLIAKTFSCSLDYLAGRDKI